jgi:hypothetical protein
VTRANARYREGPLAVSAFIASLRCEHCNRSGCSIFAVPLAIGPDGLSGLRAWCSSGCAQHAGWPWLIPLNRRTRHAPRIEQRREVQ